MYIWIQLFLALKFELNVELVRELELELRFNNKLREIFCVFSFDTESEREHTNELSKNIRLDYYDYWLALPNIIEYCIGKSSAVLR